MTRDEFIQKLIDINACKESLLWVRSTPGTPEELWRACGNGDWLLWLIENVGIAPLCPASRESLWINHKEKMAPIQAEYKAKVAPIQAEYNAKVTPLLHERDKEMGPISIRRDANSVDLAPIRAKYHAKLELIWVEYEASEAPFLVEYEAKVAPLWVAYRENLARLTVFGVPWCKIEAALVNRVTLIT